MGQARVPWADMAAGISLFVLKPPTTGLAAWDGTLGSGASRDLMRRDGASMMEAWV